MTFRFDKLTIRAQEAIAKAQSLASEHGNPEIDPVHLMAALLEETDGIVGPVLDKIGANRAQLDQIVRSELNRFPKSSGGNEPQPNRELREVLEGSAKRAAEMKDEFVSTEHLLLALATVKSKAKEILESQCRGRTVHSRRAPIGSRRAPG